MGFEIHFRMFLPLGFVKECLWREKNALHIRPWNKGFNPFFFSLTLGNPNKATEPGALGSTSNATIDNGERLSDYIEVRDELFTIRD